MSILFCGLKKEKKPKNEKHDMSHETNMKGWLKTDGKLNFVSLKKVNSS